MSEQTAPVVRIAVDSSSARRASDHISANLPQPYCTGDRCEDCGAPGPDDVHGEGWPY